MVSSTARRLELAGPEVTSERQAEGLRWFHVTVLSNFARGYDRYTRTYRKGLIPESTYPNEFYVLAKRDLDIGVAKARKLKSKLAILNDQIVAIEARLPAGRVSPNVRNGLGSVWASPDLPVTRVYRVLDGNRLEPTTVEEVTAASLALHEAAFRPYPTLASRSVSFLPIARGCQASCPFCFSEASASTDQKQQHLDWSAVRAWLQLAKSRGAERAVITGGGEPTMLPFSDLSRLVGECRHQVAKVVLITNGISLARLDPSDAIERLVALRRVGLSVLAVSRHHQDERINGTLMNAETRTPQLLDAARRAHEGPCATLQTRLICVLQEGGVASTRNVDDYVRWAVASGAHEVCFKELYVSTTAESVYHSRAANAWSESHQVPLSVVLEWAERRGLRVEKRLPWGAPVFGGQVDGRDVRVAAYTEPSLFWERTHGIARSWNVMADGSCLASLEDTRSRLEERDLAGPAVGIEP
jgi:molybdenum cofactor biosynthesis enzyme MoaA